MDITVAQHILGPVNWTGPGVLRIAADSQFVDSLGKTVLAGAKDKNYKTAAITVAAGVGTLAAFIVSSTTDSLDNQEATYTGYIFDAGGVFRGTLFEEWRIPTSLGTTPTHAQLGVFNDSPRPRRLDTGYTRDQVNALIPQIRSGRVTLVAGEGIVGLSPAEPSTDYSVAALSDVHETLLVENKTVNGFTITSNVGASDSEVNWILHRN